jgi:hypothetical protein
MEVAKRGAWGRWSGHDAGHITRIYESDRTFVALDPGAVGHRGWGERRMPCSSGAPVTTSIMELHRRGTIAANSGDRLRGPLSCVDAARIGGDARRPVASRAKPYGDSMKSDSRRTLRLAVHVLGVLGGVLALCGCDRPVAPTTESPSEFARHVDSLYFATGTSDRQAFLTFLEYPPAFGASPAVVTITTPRSTHFWKGYVWEDLSAGGGDSAEIMIAYSDSAVTMGLYLYQGAGTGEGAALLVDSTLTLVSTSRFSITHGAESGTCSPAAGLANPALVNAELTYTCVPVPFEVSADVQVPGVLDGEPTVTELLTLSISKVVGPRLTN